jgi:TPR repeat protein
MSTYIGGRVGRGIFFLTGLRLKRAMAAITAAMAALLLAAACGPAAAGPVEEARLYLRGTSSVPANLPKAFSLFSGAAKEGDPLAAYYLGLMYKNGMAVPRDARAAARWLKFAAQRELPAAMFMLANLYLSGDGVPRDDQAARRWIEKAADLEYPEAVMAMAIGLRDGSMGFDRNEALSEAQMKFAAHALQHRTGTGY